MDKGKRSYLLIGIISVTVMFGIGLNTKNVEAACGASTSSCKTCHEVQGQDPVNQKGAWHVQHAFGDFCSACHLGVPTETDKTKAHAGVIKNPISQPDQTCTSCHPSDTAARVAKYGGSGSGGSGGSVTTNSGAAGTSANATPSAAASQVPSVPSAAASQTPASADPNYDVIDFNKNTPTPFPWLTIIFLVLDVLAVLVLATMVWRWLKGVWPWSYVRRRPANLLDLNHLSPELQNLINDFRNADSETVLAAEELLQRGKGGEKLLQTVAKLPENLVTRLQTLSETETELLFQLSRALREQKGGVEHAN
ncbi:MAG: cytochrome c3 family protein [Peptococcaceae bacterium]|nr:cytochrome c3 family protein [Peptococcaceae bacterium]